MTSDQLAPDFVQLSLENLQERQLHILSGQPVPPPDCPHGKKVSPYVQSQLLLLLFMPIVSHLAAPHCSVKSPALSTQWPCCRFWKLLSGPWTHCYSRVNKLSYPSLCSQGKCSRHHHHGGCPWTLSSLLMSFLHQSAPNWAECLYICPSWISSCSCWPTPPVCLGPSGC